MAQNNGDGSVSKTEFVWLMTQLAAKDRDAYRKLRERGWNSAEAKRILDGKSEFPN